MQDQVSHGRQPKSQRTFASSFNPRGHTIVPHFSAATPAQRMNIGSYVLANNLFVAPMAGVTDRPFRQLCRRWARAMRSARW